MMLRILSALALITGASAGLVAAHTAVMDPVTCSGGDTYTNGVTPVGSPSGSPAPGTIDDPRSHTLYVVFHQSDASKPEKYSDADAMGPISLWKEANNKRGLQPTAYECKYTDGHVWGVDDPKIANEPVADDDDAKAHPELVRVDADMRIVAYP